MIPDKPRNRVRSTGIAREEERAWVGFYRRVRSDPAIAAEVLAQLDADPDSKRTHLALYLCCRESLRLAEIRHQRQHRFGSFVRWCCQALFIRPAHRARELPGTIGEWAAACLPEVPGGPLSTERRPIGVRISESSAASAQSSEDPIGKTSRPSADRPPMAA